MDSRETSLVQDLLNDPERGAERLVGQYRERLYAIAFSLCHDHMTAEDLVFRTFERVVHNIATCRSEEALLEWMKTILRNEWRMSVRRGMVRATTLEGGPDDLEKLAGPGVDGDEAIARAVDGDFVREAIETLSPEAREVLIQHYFLGMPLGQIARFLRLPVGTVKSRLHYARLSLAARLRPTGRGVAALLVALLLFGVGSWAAVVGGRAALVAAGLLKSASSAETEGPATSSAPEASADEASPSDTALLRSASPDATPSVDRSFDEPSSGAATASSDLSNQPSDTPDIPSTPDTTQTMKTSSLLPVVAFAALSPLAAMSNDYILPAGQSDTMSTSVTYGTMTISGALTVNGGATVSASETSLGGDSGDSAGISVSGNGTKFDSQKVTIGGASGGTGTITATDGGVVVIGKTYNDANLLTVASGAVPSEGDVIDVLELGAGTHSIARLSNASSYPARIRLVESGAKLSTRSSASTQWKTSFASGNWILDADSPVEISLDCPPNHYLTGGSARIATTGSGTFHVVGGSMTYDAIMTFGNTGGIAIDSGFSFGLKAGKADLSGLRGPLTINGTLRAANNAVYGDGLVVGANGAVTTSSTQDFVFGSGDANGSLSAAIPSSNRVVKVGSGTLTVTGTSSAGRLTISNGTVKVSAAFTVGALELEDGATLVVDDGVDFVTGALEEHGAATITTLGTGRFVYGSDSPSAIAHASLGGSFVKTGTGTTSIYAPQSMPDSLHVAEGGVVFSAYGLSQRYWKWTFKGLSGTEPLPLQSLAVLWLFGADGNRVGEGIANATYGANADLTLNDSRKGKTTWACGPNTNITQRASYVSNYDAYSQMGKLFSANGNDNNLPALGSPLIDKSNPDSYLDLLFRLRDDDASITGYEMGLANTAGRPTDWTVSVSDDGVNWQIVDVRESMTPPTKRWYEFYNGLAYHKPFAEDFAPAETFKFTGYKSDGLEADPAKAVTLQVDDGASVDLTAFSAAPQKIGGLVVDLAAGGGTVTGGAIAPNGTLTVLNGAQGFAYGTPLPLTLSGVSDADNFASWSIFVDGVEVKGRIRIDSNGHPVVVAFGTVVYFR